ncbi:MAG: hypothetical protein FMNOHCHN_02307 [Ignavibacteriaceae bacterium]|nr:hypothetical protein [Ignavibacteriaceae bacterium]
MSFTLTAQEFNSIARTDTLLFNPKNVYLLKHFNIIPESEIITLRGRVLSRTEYLMNYGELSFSLADSVMISVFDTLFVSYSSLLITLKPVYQKRTLLKKYDDMLGDSVLIAGSGEFVSIEESIFGKGIQRSGSIYRGFTVGTNRDFSLQSGMRLEFSGYLTDDIEISAALTDENTPIQPEGTTESLDELDKVFIQLRHKNFSAVFGDYELQKKNGEFGGIKRKLQGFLAEGEYEGNSAYFGFASARGKFHSQSFSGLDGVQGPYRLSGLNGEREIIVIAGTEKVFVDGNELKRGEIHQYTIDYSLGEITFNSQFIITSASRIVVDFEYTDRRYTRNIFLAGAQSKLSKHFSMGIQFIREGDDQDSPIDLSLSDSDKELLRQAGDDRFMAVRSGVTIAALDSLGLRRGTYAARDTTINGNPETIYIYNPGDTSAVYNVTFTYVGEFKGDYRRAGIGNFIFSGKGSGAYLPVIFLPLPALTQSGNITAELNFNDVIISAELSGSLFDRNRFSSLDDNENGGYARNISLRYTPEPLSIFSDGGETVSLFFRERYIEERYVSPDRLNSVEFERDFNLIGAVTSDESLREGRVQYTLGKRFSNQTGYSVLTRGRDFSTNRLTNISEYRDESFVMSSNTDYNATTYSISEGYWLKQKITSSLTAGILQFDFPVLYEDRSEKRPGSDSVNNSSFRFYELSPGLKISPFEILTAGIHVTGRTEFSPISGNLIKESVSSGYGGDLQITGGRQFNSISSITYRKKTFTEEFRLLNRTDNDVLLVKSSTRFRLGGGDIEGDIFYEGTTKKTTKPERVFLQVETGRGNYRYRGDLNNDGIKDEGEFELTAFDGDYILLTVPSDELYPVITLNLLPRLRLNTLNFAHFGGIAGNILSQFSSETSFRIEENSTLTDYAKIYLLDFSVFRDPLTTIRGIYFFQQDLFLFGGNSDLSFRGRFNQRESMNQFSGGTEQGFGRELSIQASIRLIPEISNTTEISALHDNLSSAAAVSRNRMIRTESFTSDFSYRPVRNIETGFKVKVARSEDIYPVQPTVLDINSITLRINYAITGSGRLRLEAERTELLTQQTQNYLPYELTGGNSAGKNYFIRFNFDYRISLNLQATMYYEGRSLGGGRFINLARSEVRAFF